MMSFRMFWWLRWYLTCGVGTLAVVELMFSTLRRIGHKVPYLMLWERITMILGWPVLQGILIRNQIMGIKHDRA